ncbi:MAG: hypothetical protein HND54_10930 [Bacteroidetes bacterium]|nr:hypothetical protein [Bacteroidota bacterium]
MNKLITIILCLFCSYSFGQINMEDSTAQVIAYWSIGDKQSYSVSLQNLVINGEDTTKNETTQYDVDITVLDSSANSYTVSWLYRNFRNNSDNELIQKIISSGENLKVIIKTDELGAFLSVENWEEVSNYMKETLLSIQNEAPNTIDIMKQFEYLYSSKEAIESSAIQDIQQFYTFHGAKYTLNKILEFNMKTPNLYYPEKPFDSKITLTLDELNPDNDNFILRFTQEVNKEQLVNTTYEYLSNLAKSNGTEEPNKESFKDLSNVISNSSRIHITGWMMYSIQTKFVQAESVKNIENRIIEIK